MEGVEAPRGCGVGRGSPSPLGEGSEKFFLVFLVENTVF